MMDNFILLDEDDEKLLEYIKSKDGFITLTKNKCDSSQIDKLIQSGYIEKRFDICRKLIDEWQCDVRITHYGRKYKDNKEKYIKQKRKDKMFYPIKKCVEFIANRIDNITSSIISALMGK